MKVLIAADVYGWTMTGFLGAGGKWFLGFSTRPAAIAANEKSPPTAPKDRERAKLRY
jgi:hypothetical protein